MKGSSVKIGLLLWTVWAFASAPVLAQGIMTFDEEGWDFGDIREADGPVSHTFRFTNTGDLPVVVERISVSCGCTTPSFRQAPVRPGESGEIQVTYNPAGAEGKFSKPVAVIYNNGKNHVTLQLFGKVIAKPRVIEESYPFVLSGEVRANMLHLGFDTMEHEEVKSRTLEIINHSDRTVELATTVEPGSGFLKITAPNRLKGGEKGTITITYDLRGATLYGILSDRIRFSADGRESVLPVTSSVIAVDDFRGVDADTAPRCTISPTFHNFGRVAPGSTHICVFKLANTGHSPLVVRNIRTRKDTECDLTEGTAIAPGQHINVSVSFHVAIERYGIAAGGVTLIVNDPQRPMRELRISAEIK